MPAIIWVKKEAHLIKAINISKMSLKNELTSNRKTHTNVLIMHQKRVRLTIQYIAPEDTE